MCLSILGSGVSDHVQHFLGLHLASSVFDPDHAFALGRQMGRENNGSAAHGGVYLQKDCLGVQEPHR